MTWPLIFSLGIEIFFVHKDFKWTNSAKSNAGVICSILGLRKIKDSPKYIFSEGVRNSVKNINAYLVNGKNTIVIKRTKPLAQIPKMTSGNKPLDGGNLILSSSEASDLMREFPSFWGYCSKYISNILRR